MTQYQVTGNEYLSLPTIRQEDGAVEGVTFLYMQLKGLLEIRGDDGLICPFLSLNGKKQALTLEWRREHYWIPTFTSSQDGTQLSCTYLTPINERAFVIRLTMNNTGTKELQTDFGVEGNWDRTLHEINETTELSQGREVIRSNWNQMFIWSQKPGLPLFAFAPCTSDAQPFSEIDQGAAWEQDGFSYRIHKQITLKPQQSETLNIYFGIGYESVAAATSAKELLRQGYNALLAKTTDWLASRERYTPDERINTILNTNLFFSFFYASGRSIDTEELCLMTSRSPRYYVSAAYWDRDSLLWAFPSMIAVDPGYAREILEYVFTRQARNFGVHSRYIDGTVLEPGFELDELCAPVIALQRYVTATQDHRILNEVFIQTGLNHILKILETKNHATIDLYETFLQPTDDLHNYPYLTYDNVLVWYAYHALSVLLNRPSLADRAQAVRAAIYSHCVQKQNDKTFFAWSVDGNGHYDIYDEPPGSLQLLPFYGFCTPDDEVWQNTVHMIRDCEYPLSFAGEPIAEIGCKHAPHPWILSICNSLLCGYSQSALHHLRLTQMDNGIACESVNAQTGACETGEAFATCAGFLAFALMEALSC